MKSFFVLTALLVLAGPLRAQTTLEDIARSEQKNFMRLHKADRESVSNFDVTYNRIELKVDPAVNYITGKVTTIFKPYTDIAFAEFDLSDSLTTDSVVSHTGKLPFTHTGNILRINLPVTVGTQVTDSVTVFYQGKPASGEGFGSFVQREHDSVPIIWTLSEPYGAKDWWPCKQNLLDKVDSLDVIVTTPAAYRVASNGLLVEELTSGTNKIYHWRNRYQIANYLICFAVTNYVLYSDSVPLTNDTIEVVNYVYPESENNARLDTREIINMMVLFDSLFGTYPFNSEKYGMAQFGWGGGMEHQTMTFMGGFNYELMAHELAHHWFGDKVTCGSWSDLWLNEGFATYLSGLCYQYLSPQYWRPFLTASMDAATANADGSVWCDDTTNVSRLFSGNLTYRKGAMVLHMLRYYIGDNAFYTGLRNYLNDEAIAYGFARTVQLRQHLEATSGRSLQLFFDQWVYGKGYPTYTINWSQNFDNLVTIKIKQEQSDPSIQAFDMLLPFRFAGARNDTTIYLPNNTDEQGYSFTLPFAADTLQFDPDLWILSKGNSVVRLSAFDFSYRLYPNPVSSELQIRVESYDTRKVQIEITGAGGQKVWEEEKQFYSGSNNYTIDVSKFNAGVYMVSFIIGGEKLSSSFVKSR